MIEVASKANLRRTVFFLLSVLSLTIIKHAKAGVPLSHQPLSSAENIGHLMGEWQFIPLIDSKGEQRPSLLLSNELADKGYLEVKGQRISTASDNIEFSLKIISDSSQQAHGILQVRNSRFSCHNGALKVYFTNGKFIPFSSKTCKSPATLEAFSGEGEDAQKLAFLMRKNLPIFVVQNHLILKISHKENAAIKAFRQEVIKAHSPLSE